MRLDQKKLLAVIEITIKRGRDEPWWEATERRYWFLQFSAAELFDNAVIKLGMLVRCTERPGYHTLTSFGQGKCRNMGSSKTFRSQRPSIMPFRISCNTLFHRGPARDRLYLLSCAKAANSGSNLRCAGESHKKCDASHRA